MDDSWFDAWTRRRFGLATGGGLASLFGLAALDEADAGKNKGKKRRKRRRRQRQQRQRQRRRNQQQKPPCSGPGCSPDIVLINVDDMRESDFQALTRTKTLLRDRGTSYPNYFLATPVCAPSRASLFRGQYTHNHGVLRNSGAGGGWASFNSSGAEADTIATWLSAAAPAYRTAHVGKYLNGYNFRTGNVPPGWSDWVTPVPVNFFNYTLNVNGTAEPHGSKATDYLTDVMLRKARDIIATTPAETPLFLYFAPKAPHSPSIPAPRHEGAFAKKALNRPPSFNEADMSDKPDYMQRPPLSDTDVAALRQSNRDRLESLLSVDQAVQGILNALQAAGRLGNAYVFFVTDNGFLLGEHRRTAKLVPYEESIKMSMLVRGPGVRAGAVNQAMVANIDLAPTIADLAGVTPPGFVDGRSFAGTFDGSGSPRRAFLVAAYGGPETDPEEMEALRALPTQSPVTPYRAIRTADHTYVEYRNTAEERELYDLTADRFQLTSLHDDPGQSGLIADLSAWLATLEDCSGAACREAEEESPRTA